LRRLAVKLEIAEDQLEERVGKKLTDLNRPEAKAWIKRARAMAEEIAPSRKTPYGQWPEGREDQEAAYLKAQQEAGSFFFFKLFNGEQFGGVITDFTPYTITIKEQGSGNETVLRKLAVAYYRHAEAPAEKSSAPAKPSRSKARSQSTEEVHQPLDTGVDSDRKGEPAKPERDNMDEDRGV
jgi:sRNA-binding regulator protein Hfq